MPNYFFDEPMEPFPLLFPDYYACDFDNDVEMTECTTLTSRPYCVMTGRYAFSKVKAGSRLYKEMKAELAARRKRERVDERRAKQGRPVLAARNVYVNAFNVTCPPLTPRRRSGGDRVAKRAGMTETRGEAVWGRRGWWSRGLAMRMRGMGAMRRKGEWRGSSKEGVLKWQHEKRRTLCGRQGYMERERREAVRYARLRRFLKDAHVPSSAAKATRAKKAMAMPYLTYKTLAKVMPKRKVRIKRGDDKVVPVIIPPTPPEQPVVTPEMVASTVCEAPLPVVPATPIIGGKRRSLDVAQLCNVLATSGGKLNIGSASQLVSAVPRHVKGQPAATPARAIIREEEAERADGGAKRSRSGVATETAEDEGLGAADGIVVVGGNNGDDIIASNPAWLERFSSHDGSGVSPEVIAAVHGEQAGRELFAGMLNEAMSTTNETPPVPNDPAPHALTPEVRLEGIGHQAATISTHVTKTKTSAMFRVKPKPKTNLPPPPQPPSRASLKAHANEKASDLIPLGKGKGKAS